MSSADHADLSLDLCQVERAANGGWIVRRVPREPGLMSDIVAAVSTLAELQDWLGKHLDASPV